MMTCPNSFERCLATGRHTTSTEHARCGPTSQRHVARGARPAPRKWVLQETVQSSPRGIFPGKRQVRATQGSLHGSAVSSSKYDAILAQERPDVILMDGIHGPTDLPISLPDDHKWPPHITEGSVLIAVEGVEAGRMIVLRLGYWISVRATKRGGRMMAIGGETLHGPSQIWRSAVSSSRAPRKGEEGLTRCRPVERSLPPSAGRRGEVHTDTGTMRRRCSPKRRKPPREGLLCRRILVSVGGCGRTSKFGCGVDVALM